MSFCEQSIHSDAHVTLIISIYPLVYPVTQNACPEHTSTKIHTHVNFHYVQWLFINLKRIRILCLCIIKQFVYCSFGCHLFLYVSVIIPSALYSLHKFSKFFWQKGYQILYTAGNICLHQNQGTQTNDLDCPGYTLHQSNLCHLAYQDVTLIIQRLLFFLTSNFIT